MASRWPRRLYGTVILGSMFGGVPTDRFGRKPTLFAIGVLYLIGAIWSALAGDVYSFIARARNRRPWYRCVDDCGAALHLRDRAAGEPRLSHRDVPVQHRVRHRLIAFLLERDARRTSGENAWRWMLGVAAFPSAIYALCCFVIPESPRWLLTIGKQHEAKA